MTDREAAKRYHWFCMMGWRKPTLNHPKSILGEATHEEIDQMIQDGMKRWPIKKEFNPIDPDLPRVA